MDFLQRLYQLLYGALGDPVVLLGASLVVSVIGSMLARPASSFLYKYSKKYRFRRVFAVASLLNESKAVSSRDIFTARIFESFSYAFTLSFYAILLVVIFGIISVLRKFNDGDFEFYVSVVLSGMIVLSMFLFNLTVRNLRNMITAKLSPDDTLENLKSVIEKQSKRFTETEAGALIRYANGEISAAEMRESFPEYVGGARFHDRLLHLKIDPPNTN